MIYLVLAVLCSAMVSIFMRLSEQKIKGRLSMLSVNYGVCLLLAVIFAGSNMPALQPQDIPSTFTMGTINGIFYVLGFVLLQVSVRKNGVVLSTIFMRLGLLVPMVMSIFLFREMPGIYQGIGFFFALAAIMFISYDKNTAPGGSKTTLTLLLLAGGSADAMAKVFDQLGNPACNDHFLLCTFIVAMLLCLIFGALKNEKPGFWEALFGVLIGLPNFFFAKLLLEALGELRAVVVYPTYSVGTLLVVTLFGVVVFREKLKLLQWLAVGIIVIALILLNM